RPAWREPRGEPQPPPQFLREVQKLTKPYGVKTGLYYSVHAGQASPDAGFALLRTFEWEDREYGLSTELDILALDRLKLVKPTTFHGVQLAEGEGLPVGFADQGPSRRYTRAETGGMMPGEVVQHREGVKLTGQNAPNGFLETRDGDFVPQVGLRIIPARDSFPSFATGDRKWI